MSKHTRNIKTNSKKQNNGLQNDPTITKQTRILRSNMTGKPVKSTKSEGVTAQGLLTKRKRKNVSVTDEPPIKVVRQSHVTKQRYVQTSHSSDQDDTARGRHSRTVKQTDKKFKSKAINKRLPVKKGKSNICPRSASNRKMTASIKSKQTPRMILRSGTTRNVDSSSSSTLNAINVQKTKSSTEQCDRSYTATKTASALLKKDRTKRKKMPTLSSASEKRIRLVGKINTDLNVLVSTICCVNDHTMWIGRQAYDRLMKVEYDESNRLTVVKQFPDIDFADFCFDKANSQMLICSRTDNCILSISSSFEVTKLISVEPLCPTCITISPDNFIFVGLVHGYAYDCGEFDPRCIVKMDRDGTIHQRINSLQDGSSNFIFPFRCIVNPVNNELVVSGYKRSNVGCVANFNSEGINGFLYYWKHERIPFVPRGVTCSSQGNIFVCNEYNGDIHILNKTGQCLHLMDMKSAGLPEKPWSFSWDFSGHLLIGTMTGTTGNILITEYTDCDKET